MLLLVPLVGVGGCGDDRPGGIAFRKRTIDPAFRSEGVTVFDVDHDGRLDIVTEEQWYAGPSFEPREIRAPRAWDPLTEYAHCFGAFHRDVDGDGFEDLISFGPPGEDALWCRNPQGANQHWDCHPVTAMASGESPLITNLFEGAGSFVMGSEPDRVLGWMTPGAALDQPWQMNALTAPGFAQAARYEHGLGLGDINGDDRIDILTGSGWLEQPADRAQSPWPWHPTPICPNNCAHMFAFDINDDGMTDVIGTSPHNFGVWWFEQQRGVDAEPMFVQRDIDTMQSQNHAAHFVDLDGDGLPELITGKRWWAHFDQDPGALDPAVLVMYRLTRNAGQISWTRTDIDDDSGVGSQFEVADVDGNGALDIVVSNKKGLHFFQRVD
jgi:hypothetical protein